MGCTVCDPGWEPFGPCVETDWTCINTADRTCEINIATGLYIIETEADDNRMCLAMLDGEWYPSRVNYGNGDTFCGAMGDSDEEKKANLLGEGEAIFRFSHIGNKNDQEIKRGGDMYVIEKDIGAGDWEGLGKQYALMNNKQAVFILSFMQAVEEA